MEREPCSTKRLSAPENLFRPADLIATWQQRADYLHQFGDPNSAPLWRTAAVELEQALAAFGGETLTPEHAAKVTGYSPDYIRKQIASGDLPNAGRKNAPRVRRADLKAKRQSGRGRPPHPAAQQEHTKQATRERCSGRRFWRARQALSWSTITRAATRRPQPMIGPSRGRSWTLAACSTCPATTT